MRTSELHKDQPILAFFAPSGANTTPFCQPTKRPFHDPTSCWVLVLFKNWRGQWFATTPLVSNVLLIIGFGYETMDIVEIISSVQTEMLFLGWARHHNGKDKVIDRPFIMLVSSSKINCQRRATLINQDMYLRPAFTAVGRIVSCCRSAQRSRDRFAVDCLPFPTNPALPIVEANHRLQDFVPDTLLLPRLESLMQNTAGNAEPIAVDRFPLAACPQNVPEAVDDSPIIGLRTPWPSFFARLRQILFDAAPQGTWDTEIVDIFRLLFILVFQDAPRWKFVFGQTNFPQGASFV